jgi:hypothetical protein
MADSDSWVLPGDLSYLSIDTALPASNIAYDVYSGATMLTSFGFASTEYQNLIDSGWTQITGINAEDTPTEHYQGVAFYKVVNGTTVVLIANRGSWPGG